jgi:hypothetical protein
MMSILGKVPDAIAVLYHTFAERYPAIEPSAFKALNTNVLSEVGVGVALLGGRVEISLRVDQLMGKAVNLRTRDEVQFTLDCALLAHIVARKLSAETAFGQTILTISAWLNIEGGVGAVETLLAKVSRPSSNLFEANRIGAQSVQYLPRFNVSNASEGWSAQITAEASVVPDADLFLTRHYEFLANTKYSTIEQQLGFVDFSTSAIFEWLGVEWTG